MRTAAIIIIRNSREEILLQKRTLDASISPNLWGLWGGRVEIGERDIEAAKRELKEELDIEIHENELERLGSYVCSYKSDRWNGSVFLLKGKPIDHYHLLEGERMMYVSYAQIQLQEIQLDENALGILKHYPPETENLKH